MLAYHLLLFIFGLVNNQSLSNLGSLIFIVVIYFSIRIYRDQLSEGRIEFGKAFTIGFLTALVMGIIGAFYTYIEYKYLSPGLIEEMMILMEERLINKGISDDQIEMQSQLMEQILGPGLMAFGILFSSAFWGALISLLLAAVLKRQRNPLIDNES